MGPNLLNVIFCCIVFKVSLYNFSHCVLLGPYDVEMTNTDDDEGHTILWEPQ